MAQNQKKGNGPSYRNGQDSRKGRREFSPAKEKKQESAERVPGERRSYQQYEFRPKESAHHTDQTDAGNEYILTGRNPIR